MKALKALSWERNVDWKDEDINETIVLLVRLQFYQLAKLMPRDLDGSYVHKLTVPEEIQYVVLVCLLGKAGFVPNDEDTRLTYALAQRRFNVCLKPKYNS